jgi:hypothetical protein
MENSIELAIGAVAGAVIGYLLGGLGKTKAANSKSDAGGLITHIGGKPAKP